VFFRPSLSWLHSPGYTLLATPPCHFKRGPKVHLALSSICCSYHLFGRVCVCVGAPHLVQSVSWHVCWCSPPCPHSLTGPACTCTHTHTHFSTNNTRSCLLLCAGTHMCSHTYTYAHTHTHTLSPLCHTGTPPPLLRIHPPALPTPPPALPTRPQAQPTHPRAQPTPPRALRIPPHPLRTPRQARLTLQLLQRE
jgi:hypothetical protein